MMWQVELGAILGSGMIYASGCMLSSWMSGPQTLSSRILVEIGKRLGDYGRRADAFTAFFLARRWDIFWLGREHPILEMHNRQLAVLAGVLGWRDLQTHYTQQLAAVTYNKPEAGTGSHLRELAATAKSHAELLVAKLSSRLR